MNEDIDYTYNKLHRSHPNLYEYVSFEKFRQVVDSIKSTITDSLDILTFYNKLRGLNLYIRDGHTAITLPDNVLPKHFVKKKMPFEIVWFNDKIYIKQNYSSDSTILPKTEILEVNGVKAKEIFETIQNRQTRDGYNSTFPIWVTENYFYAKYGLNFGYPEKINLKLKFNDEVLHKSIDAISVDSMRIYYKLRYKDKEPKRVSSKGIYLHQINDTIAHLRIKTFSSSILRKRYKQKFRKSIRTIFHKLEQSKTKMLILDLRGNLGGESTNGNYLLSHLIPKPYDIVECTDIVRRKENEKTEKRIKNRGLRFRIRMAKKWNKFTYKNKLMVMSDGGSFSCSGIVASSLERYIPVISVGEETGGNMTRISGAGSKKKLPNSKITVKIPVTRYTIRPENEINRYGVKPDLPFEFTLDQKMSFEDVWLQKAFKIATNALR